ncbi:MAG TPA: hypothetical protein PKA68_05940 [Arachnia sp.]|nr:hypothetical protein [Arachnia sp.]
MYADLSERFLVTVYQTRIVEDRGGDYLVYSLAISNESDQPYEDLVVTVIPTSQIDQYLAAGAIPVPMSPVDIAAKGAVPGPTEGVGVDVFAERLLSDDKFMKDAGLRREDLWELAEEYEITVTWKGGGEENYQLSSPVVDETSH